MGSKVTIEFNNESYTAQYNEQTGYYEVNLTAPDIGGIYNAEINYQGIIPTIKAQETKVIQVLAKEKIKIESSKIFMWIFDYRDFSVKDIVEIADYEINIDEETNANSILDIIKKTTATAKDIIATKKNNEPIYFGIIDNIKNENGEKLYQDTTKYITNIFDQTIKLENEELIKTTGVEDFIANAIETNFISSSDTFINKTYLEVRVKTHTILQTSVSNVQDNIYNLHTWMTNCTQLYNINYNFFIEGKKLILEIEKKEVQKELIDVNAQAISNYTEVFETSVVAKAVVLTSTDTYTLYLLADRTTTEDSTDENRADGKIETVYTEKYEDARQKALDTMKSNSYNHNITFDIYDRYIKVGTPIAIKTKESLIFDTYISAVKITKNKFVNHTCGNIRIGFINKLKKERNK